MDRISKFRSSSRCYNTRNKFKWVSFRYFLFYKELVEQKTLNTNTRSGFSNSMKMQSWQLDIMHVHNAIASQLTPRPRAARFVVMQAQCQVAQQLYKADMSESCCLCRGGRRACCLTIAINLHKLCCSYIIATGVFRKYVRAGECKPATDLETWNSYRLLSYAANKFIQKLIKHKKN